MSARISVFCFWCGSFAIENRKRCACGTFCDCSGSLGGHVPVALTPRVELELCSLGIKPGRWKRKDPPPSWAEAASASLARGITGRIDWIEVPPPPDYVKWGYCTSCPCGRAVAMDAYRSDRDVRRIPDAPSLVWIGRCSGCSRHFRAVGRPA